MNLGLLNQMNNDNDIVTDKQLEIVKKVTYGQLLDLLEIKKRLDSKILELDLEISKEEKRTIYYDKDYISDLKWVKQELKQILKIDSN